jgi:hypothetical protein
MAPMKKMMPSTMMPGARAFMARVKPEPYGVAAITPAAGGDPSAQCRRARASRAAEGSPGASAAKYSAMLVGTVGTEGNGDARVAGASRPKETAFSVLGGTLTCGA